MLTSQFLNFSRIYPAGSVSLGNDLYNRDLYNRARSTVQSHLGPASTELAVTSGARQEERIEAKLFYCRAGAFLPRAPAKNTHSASFRLRGSRWTCRCCPPANQRCG